MFLTVGSAVISAGTFLCLRRGVSLSRAFLWLREFFSLPTQRCFPETLGGSSGKRLFSAYAEVFPIWLSGAHVTVAFLCLRRGVSTLKIGAMYVVGFSLPTQRCFQADDLLKSELELFSAYAEVFLDAGISEMAEVSFLCLRRGVSRRASPRSPTGALFSAYAEVFLSASG